jgi:tetratricopeptide (TPR) repeat protein
LVDLVGSTRLATSVGPVRADELRDEFFALLRAAIEPSGGREFKNTGDGMFVAFSSASAAVACAVVVQQLFERRYRSHEQRLQLRIGLGTGESTVRDGDYFGMPTIEAARLCDKAPAGGIFVSPMTKMAAGRVDAAGFESVGELELKGIPEPMEAFAVVWAPLSDESGMAVGGWPVPEVLRAVPRVSYVGRIDERGMIERARCLARAGERQLVLLSGEPGIGKTRLASFEALAAHGEGFAVAWGACSEDLAVPYEPWIEVCSLLVEHVGDELLAEHVARCGGEVGRLASNLARRLPDVPTPQSSDSETERFLLFKAVAEMLRAVGASVPLCVVLDDFHWADAQSVALLKHVVRAVERGALQVVVTYRDSDLTKDHPLTGVLADLRRFEGVERIALTGLGPDEVAKLLGAAAGHELDADGLALAGELATETGGNPFFVGEILRSLIESGAVRFDEDTGRWSLNLAAVRSLPDSVREVIDRRVDRLGEDAREALTVAAVVGRSFDLRLLSQLVELPEGRLLDELEAAVGATLLRESSDQVGRFTFEHALINHTLYQALGATRRARLHHRVALALESLHGTDSDEQLSDLAMHWRLATASVDSDKAAGYAIRAGRRALERLAPSEAARLFDDALTLLSPGDTVDRCDALLGLGEAQRQTGDASYCDTLLKASRLASTLSDGERAARAALANTRGGVPSSLGRPVAAKVAAIERALELDGDPDRRAMLLSQWALELLYEPDYPYRRALAEQALTLAHEIGNPNTTARVLRDFYYVYFHHDGLEHRLAHLDELRASAQAAGDPALEFGAASAELHVMVESGEMARAQAAIERRGAIADRVGEPTMRWFTAYSSTTCMALLRGQLAEAERHAERAFQIGSEAAEPDAAMVYGAQLLSVRVLQGRGGEVITMLEEGVRANPLLPAWKAFLATALCWLGRRDDAAAIVTEAAVDGFQHIGFDNARTTALAMYADAAAQAGVVDAAAILYELIEPWADQIVWSGVGAAGHARTYLGLLAAALGWDERADTHFARAIEIQERDGIVLWAARARLGWAEALAARGETRRAREQAAHALELAREHGYGFIEPRAVTILTAKSAPA